MSHSNDFESQITDKQALVRALLLVERPKQQKCFTQNQIEVYDHPAMMKTYTGANLREAEVIIRQRHLGLSNDIGFYKAENGTYTASIDGYQGYDTQWLERLYTYYNFEVTKAALDEKGIKYSTDKDDNGRLRIKARFETEAKERIKSRL